MNRTGNRKGVKHSPEAIEKMRQAKLGKKRGPYRKKVKDENNNKNGEPK
jgi:hypothetical protein